MSPPSQATRASYSSPNSHAAKRRGAGKYPGAIMKQGWRKQPFEDCIERVTYTQKVQRKDFLIDGVYPIISQEEDFINGYWDNEADLFKVTTPIVIFGDHTKVLKYVDFDFVLGADGVKILQPREFLLPKFFFYQLQTANLDSLGYARHYKLLKELEIAYPGRPEQQRIVTILDEAFDGIATAKATAEKNLQNARALFESYLNAVYLGRGADAWPTRRLGDVFEVGSSKRIHERDWSPSGVPFYGGKEIVQLAKFGHAVSNAYISEQKYHDYALKYDMPKPGDILITARGTIGVGYVVQKSDKFYYKDGNIISMRAKEAANPHYLLYAFRSNALADQLGDLSGTTVTHLPLEKAKELLLRMPEIDIQNAMVERTMEFEGETQRLESIYQQKLAALETLKKSLLHRAFSGELLLLD